MKCEHCFKVCNNYFQLSEVLAEDSLGGRGGDVLEYFPSLVAVLDLLLEELGEAGVALDLCGAGELLDDADDAAHDVLRLVIGGDVGHVLLEELGELVEEAVDIADDDDGRPEDEPVEDAQTLDHALLGGVLEALDGHLGDDGGLDALRHFLDHGLNEPVGGLPHEDALVDLVLEAAEIHLLDEGRVDHGHGDCLLLNDAGVGLDCLGGGVSDGG